MADARPTAPVDRVVARLHRAGVVPVVELPSAAAALPLVEALVAGGLGCVEITFRTPAAREGLAAVRAAFPDLLLAAGTVLGIEQLESAVECGADLVVTPGTAPPLLTACLERGVPVLPGVCTPSDVELARAYGLDVLKFFPAEAIGGVAFLRALCAPYREISFVPTGGIDPTNLAAYLALPQVVACGGSWIVRRDLIARGEFARIRELAEEAVGIVGAAR